MINHLLRSDETTLTPLVLSEVHKEAERFRKFEEAIATGMPFERSLASCRGKILATVFLEPSTRTRLSFESAMLRLGGQVISASDPASMSTAKGETLADTVATVTRYADLVVVRTNRPITEACKQGCKNWKCPVINAGDGEHWHPTQALTDSFTICGEQPSFRDKVVGLAGDVEKSRTMRSFLALPYFLPINRNRVFVYDTTEFKNIYKGMPSRSVTYLGHDEFMAKLPEFDVLYTNRVQTERHDIHGMVSDFTLTKELVESMKPTAMILNPGPRRNELPAELDDDPRVKFWEQTQNGVYVRMAIINMMIGEKRSKSI